ncbi:hypothetical protein CLV88_1095 [Shimia abyssi]|uniref:Uncharacterized protein n=1 Tax=Shimia abyssi TaxID=1662395 RepID=A0A2P8FA63_9RHOB|nr:hypothetical protein CLV88_1095 [Shimia abyssi]
MPFCGPSKAAVKHHNYIEDRPSLPHWNCVRLFDHLLCHLIWRKADCFGKQSAPNLTKKLIKLRFVVLHFGEQQPARRNHEIENTVCSFHDIVRFRCAAGQTGHSTAKPANSILGSQDTNDGSWLVRSAHRRGFERPHSGVWRTLPALLASVDEVPLFQQQGVPN